MSMIGLLTGAPQGATAKAANGDATAAEGFGSTLQGALDALEEATANHQGEQHGFPAALPSAPATPAQVAQLSLVGIIGTPTGDPAAASATPPGEPGETPAASPPSASSAPTGGAFPAATASPVELAENPTGDSTRTSTPATPGTSLATAATPPVDLVETPTGHPAPVSTSSAGGTALPPLEPVETPQAIRQWGDPSTDSGLSLSKPNEPAEVSPDLRQAPLVSTSSTRLGSGSESPTRAAPVAGSATALRESPVLTSPAAPTTIADADVAPAPAPSAVPAAPASAPQTVAVASSVAAPAATASVPFATQLARPIFSLAAAGIGEHIMTVSVTPDSLGPVTVRAHVGAEGVRVELFAPNDLGRDAIRAIIPELRRDLAGAGLGGNLSLSSQNQPSPDGSAHGSNAGQPGERDGRLAASSVPASVDSGLAPTEQQVDRSGLFGTTSTIDVLA